VGQDEFLTVAVIAGILKINQQTVRNWIDPGILPALHIGRRVRVRRSDFEALLERATPAARQQASSTRSGVGSPLPQIPEAGIDG
jgi:excisionase family DNA binding protein